MSHPAIEAHRLHLNPAFVRLLGLWGFGRVFVRAQGTTLWDSQGRSYLDLLADFGAGSLGHRHPALVTALQQELGRENPDLAHTGPSPVASELAAELSRRVGLERVMLACSGGEAVEAALKLARAATRRPGLVYCRDGYHGTGLGPLSVMGSRRHRAPFGPLLSSCRAVPFGDLAALERALTRKVAAFLVEPLQGEGGVHLPPSGYLREAAELCRRRGCLLIADEVQTGLGRTGTFLACQAEGVTPDALVLGKALGGGLLPVSACLTTAAWHQRAYGRLDRFDLQGSTFAGYTLGCAAVRATLAVLDQEGLVEAARRRGAELLDGLQQRLQGHPLVTEVRGRGLLVGIELGAAPGTSWWRTSAHRLMARQVLGQWVALRLLERGFLVQPAALRWDVLKLEPALTIESAEIVRVVQGIGEVMDEGRSGLRMLGQSLRRLWSQYRSGWRF